jgi:hypothetical protein
MSPPAASICAAISNADRSWRSLEGHVLKQMGESVLIALFHRANPPVSTRQEPRFQPEACDARRRSGLTREPIPQRSLSAGSLRARCDIVFTSSSELGSTSNTSLRFIRSPMRCGRSGRTPLACSTASGNFAGCAVASVIMGTSLQPAGAQWHIRLRCADRAAPLSRPMSAEWWRLYHLRSVRPEEKPARI